MDDGNRMMTNHTVRRRAGKALKMVAFVAALGLLIVLADELTAVASTPGGYTRPAPPAPSGYTWGLPIGQFPVMSGTPTLASMTSAGLFPARGGWTGLPLGNYVVSGGTTSTSAPQTWKLSEPYFYTGKGLGFSMVGFQNALASGWSASTDGMSPVMSTGSTATTFIRCSTTEWTANASVNKQTFSHSGTGTSGGVSAAGDLYAEGSGGPTPTASDMRAITGLCPYVIGFQIQLSYFTWSTVTGASVAHTDTAYWSAESYYSGGLSYSSVAPLTAACRTEQGLAPSPDCPFQVGGVGVDGTDFASVCGSPPAAAWLDFSWLPAVIGYYSRCLFVPVNGYDPGGLIQQAVNSSPIGTTISAIEPAVYAVTAAPGACGTLIDGTAGVLGHISINTCSWTWASTLQQVLGWGVYIMGGWMVIEFILTAFSDMFGVRSAIGMVNAAERNVGTD